MGVTFTYLNCWSIKRNFVYVMSVRKFGEINTQRELKWLEYTYTYSLNPSIKCFSTRIYLLCKQQSLSEPFKCVGQNFSRWHPLIMHTPSQTYNLRLIENLNYSLLKTLMALYCLSRNFSKTHLNNDVYFRGPFQNKGIKLEAKTTFIHI